MKRLSYISFLLIITSLTACTDNAVKDEFVNIQNNNWSYDKPIKTVVEITDTSKPYNLLVNFRHTDDYRYANVWIKVSIIDPSNKKTTERKEFQLALQDGEWIGKGSGNLYSYQLVFKDNYKFNKTGNYTFIIEQNMRDNPLKHVCDVGLRIEPSI